jgi:hypothetical protein
MRLVNPICTQFLQSGHFERLLILLLCELVLCSTMDEWIACSILLRQENHTT